MVEFICGMMIEITIILEFNVFAWRDCVFKIEEYKVQWPWKIVILLQWKNNALSIMEFD